MLYIDKDQQEMKEFFVDYDEALCKSLLDKFYTLKDQVEKDLFPPGWKITRAIGSAITARLKTFAKWPTETFLRWDDFKKKIETQIIHKQKTAFNGGFLIGCYGVILSDSKRELLVRT